MRSTPSRKNFFAAESRSGALTPLGNLAGDSVRAAWSATSVCTSGVSAVFSKHSRVSFVISAQQHRFVWVSIFLIYRILVIQPGSLSSSILLTHASNSTSDGCVLPKDFKHTVAFVRK
eukprot:702811-Pyramimonas_sp.AAC.1